MVKVNDLLKTKIKDCNKTIKICSLPKEEILNNLKDDMYSDVGVNSDLNSVIYLENHHQSHLSDMIKAIVTNHIDKQDELIFWNDDNNTFYRVQDMLMLNDNLLFLI